MNTPSLLPKGIAGHLVDIIKILNFSFINPHSYTKFRQTCSVGARSGATTVVETGTYLGVNANRLANRFDKVITIELYEELYLSSSEYLSRHRNVNCMHGDALYELEPVLQAENDNSVLVYLDD